MTRMSIATMLHEWTLASLFPERTQVNQILRTMMICVMVMFLSPSQGISFSPTSLDLIVAIDGSGDVKTVQEAIDRVPENNTRRYIIRIKPGVYKQQIKVPANKPYISIIGDDAEKTILTFDLSNPQVGSTSASFSAYVGAHDFRAENISFANSFGPGAQAVALLVEADRAMFLHCRFLGWQDTLYAKAGRQYYRDCYIEGHVDFIFGAATAVFENCVIHSKGAGYITAQMRFSDAEPTGFVFRSCDLTGENTGRGVFLGRPWRPFARVVFIDTQMQGHIRPEGWDNWRDPERERTAWFGEFGSKGLGANASGRVKWAHRLTRELATMFDTAHFLSSPDGWNPLKSDDPWKIDHPSSFRPTSWQICLVQPTAWYATDEATRIADNVLLYQKDNGGWPKNIDMAMVLTESEKRSVAKTKSSSDTTIDNGATFTQLTFLARVITAKNFERHKNSFVQGVEYLLAAQYANGGFPQFFPLREGYYSHITYNDGAMAGVLTLLRDIARKKPEYSFVDEPRRLHAANAVEKGIECILKTQAMSNGRRTVWAAQYDEITLKPASARTFEPVALSGHESVDVVRFLMDIADPTPDIVSAIESAVTWFQKTQIKGMKWVRKANPTIDGGFDQIVVKDRQAGPIWARFYELGTDRPIFAGRDGVVRYRVSEIEAERRNGYRWYTDAPARLLNQDYPEWKRKLHVQ